MKIYAHSTLALTFLLLGYGELSASSSETATPTKSKDQVEFTSGEEGEPGKSVKAQAPAALEEQAVKGAPTIVAKHQTIIGGEILDLSDKGKRYNWDALFNSKTFEEAAVGEAITDNMVMIMQGKPKLVRWQVTKRDTMEASKAKNNTVQQVNDIVAQTPNGGVLYIDPKFPGAIQYYAGFLRESPKYLLLKPGEEFVDEFTQVEKVCDEMECHRTSGFVIERADKDWKLPIKKHIVTGKKFVKK